MKNIFIVGALVLSLSGCSAIFGDRSQDDLLLDAKSLSRLACGIAGIEIKDTDKLRGYLVLASGVLNGPLPTFGAIKVLVQEGFGPKNEKPSQYTNLFLGLLTDRGISDTFILNQESIEYKAVKTFVDTCVDTLPKEV